MLNQATETEDENKKKEKEREIEEKRICQHTTGRKGIGI